MKVKAIKDYYDLELNRAVKALDEFEVTVARARELAGPNNKAMQPLVEILEEPPKKATKRKKVVSNE